MEAHDYRTLATRAPVTVEPAVAAWRQKARRDETERKAVAVLTTAPIPLSGVLTLGTGIAVGNLVAVGVGLLLAAYGSGLIAYELQQARWEREVRIVLRFDRPRTVPTRAHYFGSALAARWTEIVARANASDGAESSANALGVANPEAFLAVASDGERWFPVHEGLAVFGALSNGCLPGAREGADLARLVAILASAPPSQDLRFRLEYVDGRDPRTSKELFASGYCVALAGERETG